MYSISVNYILFVSLKLSKNFSIDPQCKREGDQKHKEGIIITSLKI